VAGSLNVPKGDRSLIQFKFKFMRAQLSVPPIRSLTHVR
jgi:hypothetical protein